MTLPLTLRQAQLLLILTGKEGSAIRPGDFTALEANELIDVLRAFTKTEKL